MEKLLFFIVTALINTIPKILAFIVKYFRFSISFCNQPKDTILETYIICSNSKRSIWLEFLSNGIKTAKNVVTWIFLFGLIPIATILFLVFAFRTLLPYALLSFFVLGMLWEWIEEQEKIQYSEQQVIADQIHLSLKKSIQQELFLSLREISILLPVKPPNVETEIDVKVFQQMGVWCATATILKKQNNMLSMDELCLVQAQIQSVIKNHLENGLVFGVNCASLDGETPVLFVESVFDAGIRIQINLVIVDTYLAVQYVRRQRPEKSKPDSFDRDF